MTRFSRSVLLMFCLVFQTPLLESKNEHRYELVTNSQQKAGAFSQTRTQSPKKPKFPHRKRSKLKQYETGTGLLIGFGLFFFNLLSSGLAFLGGGGFWWILLGILLFLSVLAFLIIGILYAIQLIDQSVLIHSRDKVANWARVRFKTVCGLIIGGILLGWGGVLAWFLFPLIGGLGLIYAILSLPLVFNNLYELVTEKPSKSDKQPKGY